MEPGKLYKLIESKMLFISKDKKKNILLKKDSIIMYIEFIVETENLFRFNVLHKNKIGFMIFNKRENPLKCFIQASK